MKYPLVIFDLDGTILDTLEDLHASVNVAMDAFSMPRRSLAEVRAFVGNGIRRLMELCVPERTPIETIDAVQQVFSAHYKLHCNDKTRPYDGIHELIRELRAKGCRTAVVSNKDDYAVRALCELHFPELFDAVVGSREGVRKKPAPDSVNEVLAQLGFSRENTVYVGDSEVDLATARNAGMELITVSWGFRDEAQLKEIGCGAISSTVQELRRMLLGQSIVEARICSEDFQYLQPYFYNHPHALRCELGVGDGDEDYMANVRKRAHAIYDLLFPKGADAVIFNHWSYDDGPDDEEERFLQECRQKYPLVVVKNLKSHADPEDGVHRDRIICYPGNTGFDHCDFIERQVSQIGDHHISFVSFEHECILSIYDDRGCDVVFMTKEKLRQFYPLLEPYFLEYDLDEMRRRYED